MGWDVPCPWFWSINPAVLRDYNTSELWRLIQGCGALLTYLVYCESYACGTDCSMHFSMILREFGMKTDSLRVQWQDCEFGH